MGHLSIGFGSEHTVQRFAEIRETFTEPLCTLYNTERAAGASEKCAGQHEFGGAVARSALDVGLAQCGCGRARGFNVHRMSALGATGGVLSDFVDMRGSDAYL